MVHIKRRRRHHWFLCICPTVISVSRRRRNMYCVNSQEETTCFTSASVTNRLSSRGFSCDQKRWKYRDIRRCGPWPTSTCVETGHKSEWQYKPQRNRAKWWRHGAAIHALRQTVCRNLSRNSICSPVNCYNGQRSRQEARAYGPKRQLAWFSLLTTLR